MRASTKLSNLVAKHLQGKVQIEVIKEFNSLVIELRKGESTLGSAFERLEQLNSTNKKEAV